MAGYLLVIALISWLVWRDEHRGEHLGEHPGEGRLSKREQLRRYALVFQVLASGPGTNVIVTRTRGHALVLLSWLVRIIGASLIVSTITLEVLRQPPVGGFQPQSLADLAGRRISVRRGSVSAQLQQQPPLRGRVSMVSLPSLAAAPELLLKGHVDAVLADEQQLRHGRDQAPPAQRSRLRLALQGTNRESHAFALSPALIPRWSDGLIAAPGLIRTTQPLGGRLVSSARLWTPAGLIPVAACCCGCLVSPAAAGQAPAVDQG